MLHNILCVLSLYSDKLSLKTEPPLPPNTATTKTATCPDLNKNSSSIQYNCLNFPKQVRFSDGSTIDYTYSCSGAKLRTVHKIGGATITTDYCGNVIYENGVAKRLLVDGGYVSLPDGKYYFNLTDHQGNVRVVADAVGAVKEVNHYYPFGGLFANSTSVQPYKYNGKELDTKNGLNWYDYGARQYDAALGRWHAMDPLAEKYYAVSPYAYCLDNPIRFVDPDGKLPIDTFWDIADVAIAPSR